MIASPTVAGSPQPSGPAMASASAAATAAMVPVKITAKVSQPTMKPAAGWTPSRR